MSLVRVLMVILLVACGSTTKTTEPQTAKEKQLAEAKKSGDIDGPNKKWGTWRYSGDRTDCFYVVGRKCFKTEAVACKSAGCKTGKKCKSVGAGPATVSCK